MDANTNPIELCGTVAAVIYQNEENGYTVLKLDVDDGSQTMVVGCIPYAVPGESMIVTGSWMTHPAHGQQFKAEFAERTMPETADAIYAYLAGRAVRGIGPATASLMVSRFGADTLNARIRAGKALHDQRHQSLQGQGHVGKFPPSGRYAPPDRVSGLGEHPPGHCPADVPVLRG